MAETLYNEVPYPSAVYAQTHPDRLAMHATLLGMSPAPVENCRVLELGCGDGWNLIAMAYGLPGSEFVGIDLASEPIARGMALAGRLGLENVDLREMDVADAADLGEFDYIIAHGLYSWVPAHVREKVMALCARSLSPQGVAYISYNAYPGNHARDLVRGMMRYHAAHFEDPVQKIRQGLGLVRFLAESQGPHEVRGVYHDLLAQELERLEKYTDGGVFHDDLGSVNQPFYFHEFMGAAKPHGLQFLAEADVMDNQRRKYPPRVEEVLAALDPEDIVGQQQYLDFLRCRAFRQTLLCRSGVRLDRSIPPERIRELRVAAEIRPASEKPDLESISPELFLGPKKSEVETGLPLVKVAFAAIGAAWPACVHFRELLDHAMRGLGRSGAEQTAEQTAEDTARLAAALGQAHSIGFVEFRTHRPRLVAQPGGRPRASALAQVQLSLGERVTTLLHGVFEMKDALGRELLRLMDGTRDFPTLKAELEKLPAARGIAVTEAAVAENAGTLARHALLVG